MKKKILGIFKESADIKQRFVETHAESIAEVARLIATSFNDGGKLLIFGNGGSSTDASHIAAEFVGRFNMERPGLPAVALNTDMAIITSVANDYGYDDVFARQLKALAEEGDVVIGITTSGSSKNVLKAFEAAKRKNLKTVAFTGSKGDKLSLKVDYVFVVPSIVTARVQETHNTLGHVLCQMVEEILFHAPRRK
jgi:D-sedoheptulose 7-phosphate isomerase